MKNDFSTDIDEFEVEIADARRSHNLVINVHLFIAFVIFSLIVFALALPRSTWIIASKKASSQIETSNEPIQIETEYFYNYDTNNLKRMKSVSGSVFYYIMPLAKYSISGRLINKNTLFLYGFGDFDKIAKIDLGMVWGDMAKENYFHKIGSDSRQTGHSRELFYYFKSEYAKENKEKFSYLNTHISHTHVIPANKKILSAVKSVRKGEAIKLEGYLVDVYDNKRNRIATTSLSREDTDETSRGGGACEVMYVNRVQIGKKIFE